MHDDETTPAGVPRSLREFAIEGRSFAAEPLAPGLYLVATPIGNLADVTLRALRMLAGADLILAEDTRTSRVLLDRYAIRTPLRAFHAHNEREAAARILKRIREGYSIALISDAGTPLISDPGAHLLAEVVAADLPLSIAPGATAAVAALALSGFAGGPFYFEGFLPPRSAQRRARLKLLSGIPAALVIYEAPHRLIETLEDMAAMLPGRSAAVARELTKRHEEVRRGSPAALATTYAATPPRGEIAIVVGPPADDAPPETATLVNIDARLDAALAATSLKQAVADIAAATGLPRRVVYARALARKGRA